MFEITFLIILALVWIVFASIQDLRNREVANWLNFSLIIFALGFRFFYCLFSQNNFGFFYQGLIGFGIFLVIGNLFYYSRLFAGGDAKLMIALGAVLPFSESFLVNFKIFVLFFFIFLFIGGFYGLIWSVVLCLNNFKVFKKEFCEQLNKNKKLIYLVLFFGLGLMVFGAIESLFFLLGVLVFILPYFYIYAKAVDESCMVKKIKTTQLTEGDWIYEDLKVGGKFIKKSWDGLNKNEIMLIKKKYKEIKVKQGIPFVPVFLISFLFLLFFWKTNLIDILWNSFW